MKDLAESDYWREALHLGVEIENAATIFYVDEEINQRSRESRAVFDALNRESLFWNTFVYSLQTSLFVILGRIFDDAPDAYSIHKFLNRTLEHTEFFSLDALAKRKTSLGVKPEHVQRIVATSWAPKDAGDLKHLRNALKPHGKRFGAVYKPVRNGIFAHRLSNIREEISQLFAPTNRAEIAAMISCLQAVMKAIEGLYLNGIEPVLNLSDDGTGERIRKRIRKVLDAIAGDLHSE